MNSKKYMFYKRETKKRRKYLFISHHPTQFRNLITCKNNADFSIIFNLYLSHVHGTAKEFSDIVTLTFILQCLAGRGIKFIGKIKCFYLHTRESICKYPSNIRLLNDI